MSQVREMVLYTFFSSSLLCGREGKGIVVQNWEVCGRNHVYNPNSIY